MIRQSEAARTAAQFLSFGSFFLSCPLGLWDSCLFAQISFDRVLEVAVVDGLCVAGFMASLALGLGSMARGTARVPKPLCCGRSPGLWRASACSGDSRGRRACQRFRRGR